MSPGTARALSAAVLLIGLAATGCPTPPEETTTPLPLLTTDDPEAEARLRDARTAEEEGRTEEAGRAYEAFLTDFPEDPLFPVAQLALGRLALAEGDVARARALFGQVARSEDPSMAERGRFYAGVAMQLSGEPLEALGALTPFVGRLVDPEENALLLRTMAAASEQLGDDVGAAEALDALMAASVPEVDREEARTHLSELLEERAESDEIQEIYARLRGDRPGWPLAASRAARDAFEQGNMARVREIVAAMRERGVELDAQLSAIALRAERTGQADPNVIGAILPLTGRGREVGQLAQRGLMLAAGTPPSGPMTADTPQVVFRDSGADPQRAAAAVDDLVSLHRVIAIVGPVSGPAAEAAAARAQELGVPLIALSPAEGVTARGPMVFRLLGSAGAETSALVAAARARGVQRFAIAHPDHAYGLAMRAAFAGAVESQGGELVADVGYAAGATSFREQVEALAAGSPEAIFLPDAARTIALLAPALAAAGIWSAPTDAPAPARGRNVTLLLPSVAWDAETGRTSARYLSGALVSAPFSPEGSAAATRAFVTAWSSRYTNAPDQYAAAAYDAYRLLRAAVAGGARTRDEVAARLATARLETAGPSGGFDPSRGPARATRILVVQNGALVAP